MAENELVQVEMGSSTSIAVRNESAQGNTATVIAKSIEMQVYAIELLAKELPINSEFIATVEKLRQILSKYSTGQNPNPELQNGNVAVSNNYHNNETVDSGPVNLIIDRQVDTIKRLEQQLELVSGEKENLESILKEKDDIIEQQENFIEQILTQHQNQHNNIESISSQVNNNTTIASDQITVSFPATTDVHEGRSLIVSSSASSRDKILPRHKNFEAVKQHIRKISIESKLVIANQRKEKLLMKKQLLLQQLRSIAQDGA